jgi:hypothetical protein
MAEEQTGLAIFEGKQIRRTWHNDEWWFAVADIVELLSVSADVKQYIKKRRSRDPELGDKGGTICTPLAMEAADGRIRRITASNLEDLFRIIQSINSPKAEPFKRWLAKVGKQRIDELENPELSFVRMKADYRVMGYFDEWIIKRLQSINIRKTLKCCMIAHSVNIELTGRAGTCIERVQLGHEYQESIPRKKNELQPTHQTNRLRQHEYG